MTALDRLLREGLTKYPEACLAVFTFEEELKKRVAKCVDSRNDWGPLTYKTKTGVSTSGSPAGGWYVGCNVFLKLADDDVKLSVGYWWSAPGSPYPAAAAVGVEIGPDAVRVSDEERQTSGISSLVFHGRPYLVAALPDDLDIANPLDAVLSVLFKRISAKQ
jgi:hypothetical protein